MHACVMHQEKPPDVTSVASHAGCARSTAQLYLKELKELDWVRERKSGKRVLWIPTEHGKTTFLVHVEEIMERTHRTVMELLGPY